jgi:lipopolysaccharide exporter
MSLKRSAVAGVQWTAISSVVTALVQFGQIAILARLLHPSDFGLMAMVIIVLNFSEQYVDAGISNAMIHRQDSFSDRLSSFYWMNVLIGCFTFVIIVLATPLVAALFHQPRLASLVPLAAVTFLIGPFGSQFQILLQKELDFKTGAIISMTKASVAAGVAISAAYVGYGVLSLIFGQLAGVLVATGLLVVRGWQQWPPMLRFRCADLDGFLGFGLYQMGERTLNFLTSRSDQILIGALLGSQALGYYSLAWNLIILPVNRINPVLTQVAFPLFAKVQNERQRLANGYMTLLRVLTTVNSPILLGCAATASTLIPVIYGDQWIRSIFLVQVLAGVGLLRCVLNPMGPLLLAKGRADLGFFWDLCVFIPQISVVTLALYIAGLVGVVFSLLCLHIVYFFAYYWFVLRRLVGSCFKQFLTSALGPFAIASAMAISTWVLSRYIGSRSVSALSIEVCAGALIYAMLNLLLQRAWLRGMLSLWRDG